MKKTLSILLAFAMLVANTAGWAASTQSVTIAITIAHSKDIEVGGSASLTITPGTTAVSGTAITVKNVGTGINETITLTQTIPTGWTAHYQFAAAKPAAADAGWKLPADISEALASNETKNLWLKLAAPAATSETGINIALTVKAN